MRLRSSLERRRGRVHSGIRRDKIRQVLSVLVVAFHREYALSQARPLDSMLLPMSRHTRSVYAWVTLIKSSKMSWRSQR